MARHTRAGTTLVLVLLLSVTCSVSPQSSPVRRQTRRPTVTFTTGRPLAELEWSSRRAGAPPVSQPFSTDSKFTEQMRVDAAAEVKQMFYHGYDNYMKHAFPHDELKPLTKTWTDSLGELGNLKMEFLPKKYKGSALTLIDATTTLAVLNNRTEFAKNVLWMSENLNFDVDVRVNAFEVNIRVLGGLLSAHCIASGGSDAIGGMSEGTKQEPDDYQDEKFVPNYDGALLPIAKDLGERLLKAFDTPSGLPYAWVNLRHGVRRGETTEQNVAAIGSFALEFGTLSRLTRDWRFENASKRAIKTLWHKRSHRDLLGNTIDVKTAKWINRSGGVGAGNDSFFEYLLKAFVAFGDDEVFDIFCDAYVAVIKWYHDDGWYHEAHLDTGKPTHLQATSLQAFWPGVQVLIGDLESAKKSWGRFFGLWTEFGASPERYLYTEKQVHPSEKQYPLRPELAESTLLLWSATKDDVYRHAGQKMASDLVKHAKVKFGFASLKDVRALSRKKGATLENNMPSYFLAETCKYLYLLFHDPNGFLGGTRNVVFTTEGHPVPVWGRRETEGETFSEKKRREREKKKKASRTFFDLLEHAEAVRRENGKPFRTQTPPFVVNRDEQSVHRRYEKRWVDPSSALKFHAAIGAGYGLTSQTCPDLNAVGTTVTPPQPHEKHRGSNPGECDAPVVFASCVREGFLDSDDGSVDVFRGIEVPDVEVEDECGGAPSPRDPPAARLALLTRQIEELRRSLILNKETLRLIEMQTAAHG